MKKIPSVFQRNYDGDRLVRDEVVPGCEWVLAGEGEGTRKWDGTAAMIRDGVLYKRFDAKAGRRLPPGAEPCEPIPSKHTAHWPHWVPVGDGPEDRWFREAAEAYRSRYACLPPDGTYELVGPMINGNADRMSSHALIRHGDEPMETTRSFEGMRETLRHIPVEGIVFRHPDGRMAKIKKTDFGFAWGSKKAK